MYRCERCRGEFEDFKVAGQCPCCGGWADVRCHACGHTAHADKFIRNNNRCPRCGVIVATGFTETKESVEKTVYVPRRCSGCACEWSAEFKVVGDGTGSSHEAARRDAEERLQQKVKACQENVWEQVLCPECHCFSEDAMAKFFHAGYAASMRKNYGSAVSEGSGIVLSFLILVFGTLSIGILMGSWRSSTGFWTYFWGFLIFVVATIAILGLIVVFINAIRKNTAYYKMSLRIRSASEDELLRLIVDAYHQSGDSLLKIQWAKVPFGINAVVSREKNNSE